MRKIFILTLLLSILVLPNKIMAQSSTDLTPISPAEKVELAMELFDNTMNLNASQAEEVRNLHLALYQEIEDGTFLPQNSPNGIREHIERFNDKRKTALTTVLSSHQMLYLEKLERRLNGIDFRTQIRR